MKNWKVIINYLGNIIELTIEANTKEKALANVRKDYPDCLIKNIAEINSK